MSDAPKSPASDTMSLTPEEKATLTHAARETGSAIVATMVGFAVGGPVGAVVGSVAKPIVSATVKLVQHAVDRRKQRAERVLINAFEAAGVTPEAAVKILAENDDKTDSFFRLLTQASQSDPGIEKLFESVLAEILLSTSDFQRERLSIIGDAIQGMRHIHLKILFSLADGGGTCDSDHIASAVGIPRVELRSVVRDLESRGMIKDLGGRPVKWELRSLGEGVVRYARRVKNNKPNEALPQ